MANVTLDINKQFQKLIKDIQMMNTELIDDVIESVEDAGDKIVEKQKSLISGKNDKVAGYIKKGNVYVTKNKKLTTISTGYFADAISNKFNALLYEFGRPGKKRGGIDKLDRKIGIWGKKSILTTPHIRKGFDLCKETVTKDAIETLDKALRRFKG